MLLFLGWLLGAEAPRPDAYLPAWLRRVLEDRPAAVRAIAAAARRLGPAWQGAFPAAPQLDAALGALEAWCADPRPDCWDAVEAARAEVADARQQIAMLTMVVGDATTNRLPTLRELELRAQETERLQAWGIALRRLGLTDERALDLIAQACAGPQGEASMQVVVATALDAVRAPADMALLAAGIGDPADPEADWRPRAVQTLRRASQRLGEETTRQVIRDALVPWVLRSP